MTRMLPKLCPRCRLSYPPGYAGARCPRCGAETDTPGAPVSWLSSLAAASCGLVAAAVAGQHLVAWLLPPSLPSLAVQLGTLVPAALFAVFLGWLSRHLVPAFLPALFRTALALLAGGVLVAFFSVVSHHGPVQIDSPFLAPDFLLAVQAGCSVVVYLLLRMAGW